MSGAVGCGTRHNEATSPTESLPSRRPFRISGLNLSQPNGTFLGALQCVSLCTLTRGPRAISVVVDDLESYPHGGLHRVVTAVTGESKLKSFLSGTRASETAGPRREVAASCETTPGRCRKIIVYTPMTFETNC